MVGHAVVVDIECRTRKRITGLKVVLTSSVWHLADIAPRRDRIYRRSDGGNGSFRRSPSSWVKPINVRDGRISDTAIIIGPIV